MWTVSCLADVSKHDKVEVALSLDKKFKKSLGQDGSVTFNITGEFDERDQKRFQEKGFIVQLPIKLLTINLEQPVSTRRSNFPKKNSRAEFS